MNLTFLTPRDDAWDGFLAGVAHDFYHTASYGLFSSKYDGGEVEAALVTDGALYFFLPYIVRSLSSIVWLAGQRKGLFDITSPYGYPGPLCSPGDAGFLRAAVAKWCDVLRERGAVSGFVRMHPLLPAPLEVLASRGEIVERGRTVSIDLTLPPDEMWRQTRKGHRYDIVKQRQAGLTAAMEDSQASFAAFLEAYHQTMDRVGASRYYYFPAEYFREMKAALHGALYLCVVRDAQGTILGGGLFPEYRGIVQYHLSAAYDAHVQQRPSKVMLDYVRSWAKERGDKVLHLGGGLGAKEDSVFDFKSGFSPRRHPFHTWHVVFDAETYQILAQRRSELPSVATDDSFFPAYRA